jgi:hypothetical protein
MASLKASGLSHVHLSQQGEEIREIRQQEESNSASEQSVRSTEKFYIFKLSDTTKNGKYHMEGTDNYWDGTKMKPIRLLRNFPSIHMEDQKGLEKAFVESNRRTLIFDKRILRIADYDTTALEFLSLCNANVDNPNKKGTKKLTFFQWNPQRVAEVERAKRVAKVAEIKFASMSSDEDMRKHANYLGILFNDELGMPKSNDALRNDYELYAEAQPNKFMQSAGSKEVDVAYAIKRAILDNKIDLGVKKGSAYWSGDGGFICKMPSNVKAQAYLIEFAMLPQDESKAFLEQLKKFKY